MISGIGIYYPDGTETQRIEIVQDVEIKPTAEVIKNGKDEVFDKAFEWIKSDLRTFCRIACFYNKNKLKNFLFGTFLFIKPAKILSLPTKNSRFEEEP